jgi:hypothetical protein
VFKMGTNLVTKQERITLTLATRYNLLCDGATLN